MRNYTKYSQYHLVFLSPQGVLFVTLLSVAVDSRRVNAKPAAASEDDALPEQTSEDEQSQFKPVLIARRPLQQRPTVEVESERQPVVVVRQAPRLLQRPRDQTEEDEEQQAPQVVIRQQPGRQAQQQRAQPASSQPLIQQRIKEQPQQQKEPTAQTIRNYNKLNDDGSFTFGYEADDGSFKEETRGTDCVVRGKYGYVDPDGNKREFSYVQGNPCDPNAVEDEEQDQPLKPGEEENVPNRPNVPLNAPKPKPKKNRPTTTLFQQTFGDFEQEQPSTTPRQPGRQQQLLQEPTRRPSTISPPAGIPSSTPAPPQFRPSAATADDLESAIQNLPQPSGKGQFASTGPNSPLYTTELVFDPATGQYNTVIFQKVPKTSAGIDMRQRLPLAPAPRQPQPQPQFLQPQQSFQPHSPPQFGAQPQFRPALQPFQFQSQRPAEFDFQRPSAGGPQQKLVQQQQALTFQQSQNLFRQQQQQLLQQPFQPQSSQFFPPPSQRFATEPQFSAPKQQRLEPQPEAQQQQFVLVQPGRTPGQQNLAAGQIDAFLRGHNVQFWAK